MWNYEQILSAVGDGLRAAKRRVFLDVLGAYGRYRLAVLGSEKIGRGRLASNLVIFVNDHRHERVEFGEVADMFASIASNRGLGVGMYDSWMRGAIRAAARQLRRDYNIVAYGPQPNPAVKAEAREAVLSEWQKELDLLDGLCRDVIALPDVVQVGETFYEVEFDTDLDRSDRPKTTVMTAAPCLGCGDANWQPGEMMLGDTVAKSISCECGHELKLHPQPAFTQDPQTVVMA